MLKDSNEHEIIEGIKQGLVLIDFYSSTCGPCKMLSIILDDVNKSYDKDLRIYKIDYNKYHELADSLGVKTYPTIIIYNDGVEICREEGLQEKSKIIELLNNSIK